MTFSKTFTTGALASAMLLSSTSLVQAGWSQQDPVVSSNGSIVVDSQGDCVRTQWTQGFDECAPPAPEKTAAAEPERRTIIKTPARQLKTDERTVYFEFDKSRLTADSKQRLDTVASALKGSADVKSAQIVGFADRIGNKQYNMDLSKRRAQEVKNYLAEQGYLNTNVAKVRWLGEERPTTSCDQDMPWNEMVSCLQPDRRVEVEIDFMTDPRTARYNPNQ